MMLQKAFSRQEDSKLRFWDSKAWVLTTKNWLLRQLWSASINSHQSSTLMEGHDMTLSSYVFHLVNLTKIAKRLKTIETVA